jgi:hypothetical protein
LLTLLVAGRAEADLPTELATLDSDQFYILHIVVKNDFCLPSIEELYTRLHREGRLVLVVTPESLVANCVDCGRSCFLHIVPDLFLLSEYTSIPIIKYNSTEGT